MIFFYFLKIIFDISISKRSKKYKPHLILAKKKIQNLTKRNSKHNAKRCCKGMIEFDTVTIHFLNIFYLKLY